VVRPANLSDFQVVLAAVNGEYEMGSAFGTQVEADKKCVELQKEVN